MAGEGGTKGKSLLAAFDLLVGVTGLSLDIVGLAGPDPLDSKIDALAADIAQIDAKLDVLQATIDGLGQDILAEFNALTKRDLATARAKVETVWDELSDFQRKENPSEADKEKVSDLADAALNEMMAQFTQIDGVIPDDMAAIMVDAVNYAITMRLKVANVVEDGAIGKASIKDGLLDAAAALERIESGFFATLPGFVKTTISTTYTELGHLKTRVWDGADLAGLNLHFALERGSIIPGLAIWSDTYTVVSVSEITGAERTELYTYMTGGPFNANMTGILATRDTAAANVVAQDKAILTELSDTAVDYRSLADGDDFVGTSGDDTRVGTAGNDLITGLGGDDMLSGAGDADVIRGGSGHDRLKGGGGRDFLDGGTGRDNMSGGTGADTLMGGRGNDILSGDLGNDHMAGGAGQDTLLHWRAFQWP